LRWRLDTLHRKWQNVHHAAEFGQLGPTDGTARQMDLECLSFSRL
jgi:hypothetical protein